MNGGSFAVMHNSFAMDGHLHIGGTKVAQIIL
jgi:hypothetical protein